jgi:predicted neutral ceramidase superfamily lipid hydrolase
MLTNYKDVRFVPVDYKKRIGRSKIRPVSDTLLFLQLIVRTAMYFAPIRVLMPFILLLSGAFGVSICYDLFVLKDVTDKSLILLMFVSNTILFALLADMIDKRSS